MHFFCFVFAQFAASAPSAEDHQQQHQHQQPEPAGVYEHGGGGDDKVSAPVDPEVTTRGPSTFKDKVKGFFSNVKEGASDAYESVSDSVNGAAHKLDEKRKEAVAGTKKLVNGVVEKIKQKYESIKSDGKDEQEVHASVQQQEQQPGNDGNYYGQSESKNGGAPKL